MSRTKSAGKSDCPRCGAMPCHQKHKPRGMVDLSKIEHAGLTNPAEGVVCPQCGNGFRVHHLETFCGEFIDLETEYDSVPKYCPYCGKDLEWVV